MVLFPADRYHGETHRRAFHPLSHNYYYNIAILVDIIIEYIVMNIGIIES